MNICSTTERTAQRIATGMKAQLVFGVVAALASVVFVSNAGAIPINLATSGIASVSSTLGGFPATNAINGNRTGDNPDIWHSATPDTFATYEVDLGGDFFVDRIQILPRTNAVQNTVENFRLTVFADDGGGSPGTVVWTDDFLTGGAAANQPWGTTEPAGVLGRHVRFERLDGAPDFTTFAEFEVWGQSTPVGNNLALGGTVTASPAGFGSNILDAIDDDINAAFTHPEHGTVEGAGGPVYHSAAFGIGQFWQVDLGDETELDYIQLFNRQDLGGNTTTAFEVSVLDASLNEVFSTTFNTDGLSLNERYDFTIPVNRTVGQFVRVETTRNEFLALSEVRVFAFAPEPSTFVLAALGLCGLGIRRRNRLRK